jgi:PKD domain
MHFWPVALVVAAGTALAQTGTPVPVTTTQSPPTVQSFNIERVLPLNAFYSSFTATFPPAVQTGVTSGAIEIRESIAYDATKQLLTLNLFPVQSGAVLPTPANTIPSSSIFSTLVVNVDKVYVESSPTPGVMFVGTVSTNSPASPFGNVSGAAAAVSIGNTTDTPPKINNVVVLIAGTVVEYSPAGGGTVTFTSAPVTPPGSNGPTIVIANPGPIANRSVTLDASGTTGVNLPLSYQWSVVTGSADISGRTSVVAAGIIYGGPGSYTFRVTVTDSAGNVATKDLTVQFP